MSSSCKTPSTRRVSTRFVPTSTVLILHATAIPSQTILLLVVYMQDSWFQVTIVMILPARPSSVTTLLTQWTAQVRTSSQMSLEETMPSATREVTLQPTSATKLVLVHTSHLRRSDFLRSLPSTINLVSTFRLLVSLIRFLPSSRTHTSMVRLKQRIAQQIMTVATVSRRAVSCCSPPIIRASHSILMPRRLCQCTRSNPTVLGQVIRCSETTSSLITI